MSSKVSSNKTRVSLFLTLNSFFESLISITLVEKIGVLAAIAIL